MLFVTGALREPKGLLSNPPPVIIWVMNASITPTIAAYLEAIYNMIDEGKTVIAARVADRMDVSRPTVSATLRRMQSQDLISLGGDNQVTLTPWGLELAHQHIRRHRLLERFLADVLALEWHQVHAEADALEHSLSSLVEERLLVFLGHPTTCPHGNPIPGMGAAGLPANAVTLDQMLTGQAVLLRITEEGERDLELLRQLQVGGVVPGVTLTIRHTPEAVRIESPAGMLMVGQRQARTLWVQPLF